MTHRTPTTVYRGMFNASNSWPFSRLATFGHSGTFRPYMIDTAEAAIGRVFGQQMPTLVLRELGKGNIVAGNWTRILWSCRCKWTCGKDDMYASFRGEPVQLQTIF